jgi:peptide/nickel transport system ATP-binding protein
MSSDDRYFLDIESAVKSFPIGSQSVWSRLRGAKNRELVRAVDGITLSVGKGKTLAILGESGSGKTTLGRLIVGLDRLDSGRIALGGSEVRYARERGASRGRLQMVFQDPGSSLDPFMTVAGCVAEPISRMNLPKEVVRKRTAEALKLVGLEATYMGRRTSELSGGEKQRVAIARAIVSDPEVVVLDESTSSIDVSIQAQVLNLLVELQRIKRLTYVLITHDPNVARFMADEVAVMYMGEVVENGAANQVLLKPKHPYTQALLESAPRLASGLPSSEEKTLLAMGEPPSMINLPRGCRYEPRCPYAMPRCREREPKLLERGGVLISCYLYEQPSDGNG